MEQNEQNRLLSLLSMSYCEEPTTHEEAINSSDKGEWIDAMKKEYDSLLDNETWVLVEAPTKKLLIESQVCGVMFANLC